MAALLGGGMTAATRAVTLADESNAEKVERMRAMDNAFALLRVNGMQLQVSGRSTGQAHSTFRRAHWSSVSLPPSPLPPA